MISGAEDEQISYTHIDLRAGRIIFRLIDNLDYRLRICIMEGMAEYCRSLCPGR